VEEMHLLYYFSIFLPKKEEWQEELHNLHASSDISVIKSKRIRWAGCVRDNLCKILVAKSTGKR
jgi:hypothetical protein